MSSPLTMDGKCNGELSPPPNRKRKPAVSETVRREKRDERSLYWTAFTLRFSLGCLVWFMSSVLRIPFLEDALHYENIGMGVAQDWLAGRQSVWLTDAMASGTQAWLIVALIGGLYFVLGGLRALPILIAAYAAVTSYTPVLTYRLTRTLGGTTRAARFAGRLVVFSPCFVFWSGALYKEGLILVVLNLAIWHIVVLLRGWNTRSVMFLCAAIGLLLGLRFYIAIMLTPFAFLALMMSRSSSRQVGSQVVVYARQILIAVSIFGILFATGVVNRMTRVIPDTTADALGKIQVSRSDLATANSGYLPSANLSTPAAALAFLPLGTSYFLLVPLPWHIGRFRQNMTIPETMFWILLYPLMFIGAKAVAKTNGRAVSVIVGFTILMCLFYGLFIGNIGSAYRMRIQVWVFWAIFAGIGWDLWRPIRNRRRMHPYRDAQLL